MILAFDTYYFQDKARTVCIQFNDWTDERETNVFEETLSKVNKYISGEFYKRELPCILSLLKSIPLDNCEAIIIDGYVILDDNGKLGLGGYLHNTLDYKIPIIGIAKNNFSKIKHSKREVLRGISKKPLYITSIDFDLDLAAKKIKSMEGQYRIPTLLKKVDSLGRKKL